MGSPAVSHSLPFQAFPNRQSAMKSYRSPDGTWWGVTVKCPSHSSAMVVFAHPDGSTSRRDRYAWLNSHTADANDPQARLKPAAVLATLDDATLV